jgi:hypothetical protein
MIRVENEGELVYTCHHEERYREWKTDVQQKLSRRDYRVPKGKSASHTALDGGNYMIPNGQLWSVYDSIVRSLLYSPQKQANYLQEVIPSKEENPDRLSKFYLDLDIKFSTIDCTIDDLTPQHFLPIVQVLQEVMCEAYNGVVNNENLRCIVLMASHNVEYDRSGDTIIYKRGMHVCWDKFTTDQVSRMSVRRQMVHTLNSRFPNGMIGGVGNGSIRIENSSEYGWSYDVVDEAVSFEPRHRLPYCFKVQKDCGCDERYKVERDWRCPNHYRGRKHIHSYYELLSVMKHDGTQDDQQLQGFMFNLANMMMAVSLRIIDKDHPVKCTYDEEHMIERYPPSVGSGKSKKNDWDNPTYASRCNAFHQLVNVKYKNLSLKDTSWFFYAGTRGNWRTSYFRVYYYDLWCDNKYAKHTSNAGFIHCDLWGLHKRCTSQKSVVRRTGLMCKDFESYIKIPARFYKKLFGLKAVSPFSRGHGSIPSTFRGPPRFPNKIPSRSQIRDMAPRLRTWWLNVWHIRHSTRYDPVATWSKYHDMPLDDDAIEETR